MKPETPRCPLGTAKTYAEHQPEYLPLPVRRLEDGTVISEWTLTDVERLLAANDAGWRIRLTQQTFNTPLQPVVLDLVNRQGQTCADIEWAQTRCDICSGPAVQTINPYVDVSPVCGPNDATFQPTGDRIVRCLAHWTEISAYTLETLPAESAWWRLSIYRDAAFQYLRARKEK